ncbi:hypothetical protein B566_EDAN018102 [Ephemera danica]|nr:hypothetical protein B566_EDAN018102 [Ephemera danica]
MDLSKVKDPKKLVLCRWYFRAGFACLPFLWAVNTFWFFNEAFRREQFQEQKAIKKYVIFSALGTLIWTTLLTTWVVIFQVNRAEWGAFADRMSFMIPTGIP